MDKIGNNRGYFYRKHGGYGDVSIGEKFHLFINFSNGTTKSYPVMIGFLENKNLKYIKIRTEPNDRIIIAEAGTYHEIFVL